MATAARCTIAQVSAIVELGALDPEIMVRAWCLSFTEWLLLDGPTP